jgi:hypothetical protein
MTQEKRVSWTGDDVRRLQFLAGQKISESIAKTLDRSVAAVKLKAHWYNLSLRSKPKGK